MKYGAVYQPLVVPFNFAHFVVTQWNQGRLTAHHELFNILLFNQAFYPGSVLVTSLEPRRSLSENSKTKQILPLLSLRGRSPWQSPFNVIPAKAGIQEWWDSQFPHPDCFALGLNSG